MVTIFGTSNAKSLNYVSKELGHNENVNSVAIASGKMLYISGFLRDISALRDHSAFVSKVAEKQNLLNEAVKLAEELLTKSPLGLRMTKEALNLSLDSPSLNNVIQFENNSIVLSFSSKDLKEASSAFFGKRKPKYPLR